MNYQKIAKLGNVLHRFSTLLSLVMTIYFFLIDTGAGTLQKAVYALWLAVCIFASIRVISDLVGGERRRQRSFMTMMEQWEQHQGGPRSAVGTFMTITLVTALVKIAVPILLLIL